MKTALILYGFPRTFNYCKNSLRQFVLDPLNCDVFIACPDTFYASKKDESPELHSFYARNEDKVEQSIIDFFGSNLKSLELRQYDSKLYFDILNNNNLSLFNETTKQHTWRTLSYFHSISLSVNLFNKYIEENNCHYDAVILTRPDLKYYSNFNLNNVDFSKINCPLHFLLVMQEPCLAHIPEEERKNPEIRKRTGGATVFGFNRWLNDQIIVGTQENILIYKNLFEKSIEYYKKDMCFNQETYVGAHCLINGLDFTGSDFVSYEIWREEK